MGIRPLLVAGLALALACACHRIPERPSFLIVVLDTVRADAVSAYGAVQGTTPTVDALARRGVRYAHAYANAGWTLPSHASLFTGLLPSRHGATTKLDALPDSVTTLAETLRDAGWETVLDAENIFLSRRTHHNLDQGFERYNDFRGRRMPEHIESWLADRDARRPFLLVLNIMDAHFPYLVRRQNPYLPAGVSTASARAATQHALEYLCVPGSDDPRLPIFRGLYLGNVQAADAKLGTVLKALEDGRLAGRWHGPLVQIVVADHGEQFGERRLVRHDIGIAEPLVHVPLVVAGAPDASPGVVQTAVQLIDVMPSVLAWAGLAVPPDLRGRVLPLRDPATPMPRAIVAEWTDLHTDETASPTFRKIAAEQRRSCPAELRVDGDMRSLLRFPYKLRWYANGPPELFDVVRDPTERQDLAATHPRLVASLAAALARLVPADLPPPPRTKVEVDPVTIRMLQKLGYLDAGEVPAPNP